MVKKTKKPVQGQDFNRLNFSYFSAASLLSLLSLFLFLVAPISTTSITSTIKQPQQFQAVPPQEVYTLLPQPSRDIQMPVSKPNSGYGIGVILKDVEGNVVKDQSKITYQWEIKDKTIAELQDYGFQDECLYEVNSPCPNLHADLKALKLGTTTIKVIAKSITDDQKLAETNFNLRVVDNQIKLTYKIRFKGIDSKPDNSNNQAIKILGYNPAFDDNDEFKKFDISKSMAKVDADGVYTGEFYLDYGFLDRSGYKLCFKGPRHVQQCFSNVTFFDEQVYDYTKEPLEPGDLNIPQDGKVDSKDFDYLWNHRGNTDNYVLSAADLNLDNIINMGDISLLLQTLQTKYDEEP